MKIIEEKGDDSVSVDSLGYLGRGKGNPVWSFSQDSYHGTVININKNQFELLKKLVNNKEVADFYENVQEEQ